MTTTTTISKETMLGYLRAQLTSNPAWAVKALTLVYSYQTADEQEDKKTSLKNGAGFNGLDAEILSSFSEQVLKGRKLSPKQMAIVHRKMPRYARQVLASISPEKEEAFKASAAAWQASQKQFKAELEEVATAKNFGVIITRENQFGPYWKLVGMGAGKEDAIADAGDAMHEYGIICVVTRELTSEDDRLVNQYINNR